MLQYEHVEYSKFSTTFPYHGFFQVQLSRIEPLSTNWQTYFQRLNCRTVAAQLVFVVLCSIASNVFLDEQSIYRSVVEQTFVTHATQWRLLIWSQNWKFPVEFVLPFEIFKLHTCKKHLTGKCKQENVRKLRRRLISKLWSPESRCFIMFAFR